MDFCNAYRKENKINISSTTIILFVSGTFKHSQTLTRALAPDYLEDQNDVTALYGKLTSLGGLGMALGPTLSGYVMEACPEYGFTIMSTVLAAFFILIAGKEFNI